MPYIKHEERTQLTKAVPKTLGELNWAITTLVDEWLSDHTRNYENYNNVMGVLECAKLELYRRIVAPYEDKKKDENGDAYTIV